MISSEGSSILHTNLGNYVSASLTNSKWRNGLYEWHTEIKCETTQRHRHVQLCPDPVYIEVDRNVEERNMELSKHRRRLTGTIGTKKQGLRKV